MTTRIYEKEEKKQGTFFLLLHQEYSQSCSSTCFILIITTLMRTSSMDILLKKIKIKKNRGFYKKILIKFITKMSFFFIYLHALLTKSRNTACSG